jgi:peptide/nickel transport system substrate-binding protein
MIASLLATSLLLAGCSGGSGGNQASASGSATSSASASGNTSKAGGGEFRFGTNAEIDSLDPYLVVGGDAKGIVLFNIFEGLLKSDKDGNFFPAVAESYEVKDAGKTYSFKLRKGVKFHNGNEVTPADVRYSFDQALSGEFAHGSSAAFANIEKVDVTEAGDITITLKEANTEFTAFVTNAIIPADYTEHESHPIGTGPFKFESYAPQQELVLSKFDEYWQEGLPHLDKVSIINHADSNATLLSLQSGNIDGSALAADSITSVDESVYNIIQRNSNAVQLLALNNDYEPLKDPRVRQALSYAVDKKQIIDQAFGGYGTPVGTPIIPGLAKYFNASLTNAYPADVEKAKQLLADAGYADGFDLEIAVPSNYVVHVDTAQVIVNQLAAIGVSATIKQYDWATWLEDVYGNRNYQATVVSVGGASLSPGGELSRYRSDAEDNFFNFKSPAFDAKYDEAVAALDESKKASLYKEAQQILSEEAASVFIQDIAGLSAINNHFDGLVSYPIYAVLDFSLIKKVE